MAAALAGSLATYLFAPPRTTSAPAVGIAYQSARPATVQRGARVVGPGGSARVQLPPGNAGVQVPAGNAGVQVPAGAPGPSRAYIVAPQASRGRVQVVMPGGNASGPQAGQIVAVPGGNWIGAPMPACAVAGPGGLPVGHRMSISIVRPAAGRRVVIVGPGWRSVRTPRQIRLGLRPGKRPTVIRGAVVSPVPWSTPTCVFVGPSR